MRLFFLTIPKPLKQYTLFKKDYPFRFPSLLTVGFTSRKLTIFAYNKNSPVQRYIFKKADMNIDIAVWSNILGIAKFE